MAVFKIGDKVETIDDTIMGTVVEVDREEVTIESDEGFMLTYRPNELLLAQRSSEIRVTNHEVSMVKAEKELPKKKHTPVPRPKERNAPKMEVDLSHQPIGGFHKGHVQSRHVEPTIGDGQKAVAVCHGEAHPKSGVHPWGRGRRVERRVVLSFWTLRKPHPL